MYEKIGPLTALHPAPLRLAARRGPTTVSAFELMETTVELRELGAAEVPRIGSYRCPINSKAWPIHLLDGDLYHRLGTADPDTGGTRTIVSSLLGRWQGHAFVQNRLTCFTQGTPLRVNDPARRHSYFIGDRPEAIVGEILEDGRDRARVDVTAFVRRNLIIVEGELYHRFPNRIATTHQRPSGIFRVEEFPRYKINASRYISTMCGPNGLAAHDAHRRRWSPKGDSLPIPSIQGLDFTCRDGGPEAGDDDLDLFANSGLVAVMYRHGTLMRAAGRTIEDPETVRDAIAAMDPYLDLARVGSVRPEEASDALHRLDALLRVTLARCPDTTPNIASIREESSYLANAILPRFAPPAHDVEAIDAISLTP